MKQEPLRRIDATLSYVESDGTRSMRVGKQGSYIPVLRAKNSLFGSKDSL